MQSCCCFFWWRTLELFTGTVYRFWWNTTSADFLVSIQCCQQQFDDWVVLTQRLAQNFRPQEATRYSVKGVDLLATSCCIYAFEHAGLDMFSPNSNIIKLEQRLFLSDRHDDFPVVINTSCNMPGIKITAHAAVIDENTPAKHHFRSITLAHLETTEFYCSWVLKANSIR